MKTKINIINVMANGSVRESVKGITIPNKEFYIILNQIRSKKNEKEKDSVEMG